MPDHRREFDEDGRVRFVPVAGGPVLGVASRVEKRFLGRTEIAVFEVDLGAGLPGEATIEVRHTGGLKRSGVTVTLVEGDPAAQRVAEKLASDAKLSETLLRLDFKRFEISGDESASRAQVELVGASHVAIALPPIRSYVRLYPDQREALVSGLAEVARLVKSAR